MNKRLDSEFASPWHKRLKARDSKRIRGFSINRALKHIQAKSFNVRLFYANNRYYESDCLSKHVSIKVEGVN